MKTFLLFVFALLICSTPSIGQCPYALTLIFFTQAQINSYPIEYPGCDSVGTLIIQNGSDITDLSPLAGIRKVRNGISISNNPLLRDLKGLDGLVHAGSTFSIYDNESLQSLTGLESFTGVSVRLLIKRNPSLKNLIGLASLKEVPSLEIVENDSLVNIDGLESLRECPMLTIVGNPQLTDIDGLNDCLLWDQVYIRDNDQLLNIDGLKNAKNFSVVFIDNNESLQDLKGLKNVIEITGDLVIQSNPALTSLGVWGNITSMNGFTISGNGQLTDLDGLKSLTRLEHSVPIIIEYNESLVSIEGLNGIEYMDDEALIKIRNNNNLSECAIFYFCQQLYSPEQTIVIENNNISCNSLDEILSSCETENSHVIGRVFIDLNCNGILDTGDVFVPEHIIQSTSGIPLTSTTLQGQYIRYLHPNDSVTLQPKQIPHFTLSPFSYHFMTDSTHQVFDSADFAFCPDTLFHDLGVSLTGYNVPRPGFTNRYQVCVQNKGTFIDGGNLVFDFSNTPGSEYITILNADSPGIINGTTVTWSIDTIPFFMNLCFDVEIMLDVSTPLGTILLPHVIVNPIEPVTEIDLSNNEITISQTVVGSYDPNDKSVNLDQINFSAEATTLEYLIRFQNTGTFPATFIEVIDTLENELDIRSFEMIASSHPYTLTFPDTNTIIWRFDNINLPDSTDNEAESHGFIHFRINTRTNLALNTEVRNKAAIYFDFNDPVITNATSTIVESPVKTEEYLDITHSASINPNPNAGEFYLKLILSETTTIDLEIFNSHGHPVYSELNKHLDKGHHTILMKPNSMNAGIYFLRILSPKGLTTKKMFVVR